MRHCCRQQSDVNTLEEFSVINDTTSSLPKQKKCFDVPIITLHLQPLHNPEGKVLSISMQAVSLSLFIIQEESSIANNNTFWES